MGFLKNILVIFLILSISFVGFTAFRYYRGYELESYTGLPEIRGINYSPFYAWTDSGINKKLIRQDFWLIKDTNANFIRFWVPPSGVDQVVEITKLAKDEFKFKVMWTFTAPYASGKTSNLLKNHLEDRLVNDFEIVAKKAADANVDILCVGNEFALVREASRDSINSLVKRLATTARNYFSGNITYTALPPNGLFWVDWNDFDLISFNLYPQTDYQNYFYQLTAAKASLAQYYGKPLINTEMGSLTIDKAWEAGPDHTYPSNHPNVKLDVNTQAEVIDEGLRAIFSHQFYGVYIFTWFDSNLGFGITYSDRRPKPAYYTVQRWYSL